MGEAGHLTQWEGLGGMNLIDGAALHPLTMHCDERGNLMEILRSDAPHFERFGQAYMTTAYPGVTKAWHYHKKQTDNFTVLTGMMKVVLYDAREGSTTRGEVNEFFLGERRRALLTIPPGVYHGFKCIGPTEAIVVNLPTEVYNPEDPDEFRLDPHDNDIPYDWARRDG